MSALNRIPDRDRLEVVLMQRTGLGWCVGVGRVATGRIEREGEAYLGDRDAMDAAVALADRLDLLVLRSEAPGA